MIHSVAVVCGFVSMVSCSEQESDLQSVNQSSTHQLRIVTHTREGEAPLANVYLFRDNALVRTIQTDADDNYSSASASVRLPEGSYTLCALSPSDLSPFLLPESPTPTSAITLAEGHTMGDLLMASSTVTVDDGNTGTADMELQRKVLELSSLTISQVPADATAVTVTIAPFYSAVRFNGSYVDDDPTSCTFSLTATATAGVWQATPQQLTFPSIGVPTITVTFTRNGEDTPQTYTYTAEAALSANNKYNIAGTYTEPLGITLSGAITLQPWNTDPTSITFDFDETNAASNSNSNPSSGTDDPNAGSGSSETTNPPVAGQLYKGCYVVSVNSDAKTAVLLSPTEGTGYTVGGEKNYNVADWLDCLNDALSAWQPVEGVTGTWRIPTLEEITLFAQPAGIISDLGQGEKKSFFCMQNSELKVVVVTNADGTAKVNPSTTTGYSEEKILRPVIDITIE